MIKLRKDNQSYGGIKNIVNLSHPTVRAILRNYNILNFTTENTAQTSRPKILIVHRRTIGNTDNGNTWQWISKYCCT